MDDFSFFTLPSTGKRLKDMKVTELKSELSARRQSTIGKKSELAERLYNFEKSSTEVGNNMDVDDAKNINEENDNIVEKMEEEIQRTPQKEIDIYEDAVFSKRKSSRSERYEKAHKEEENENPYMSDDEMMPSSPKTSKTPDGRVGRRSSDIRRSVLKMLDIKDEEYGNKLFDLNKSFITPDRDEEREKRTPSREKTVDISPSRSKLRESLGSYLAQPNPENFGTPKRAVNEKPADNNSPQANNSPLKAGTSRGIRVTPTAPISKPSYSVRSGTITNRFAAQHKKLMEKQENLSDFRERLRHRHEDLTSGASSVVKRLATPKSTASSSRLPVKVDAANTGFVFQNAELTDFNFGNVAVEDYSKITKGIPANVTTRTASARPASATRPAPTSKIDAKQMSKRAKTLPRKLTRIDEKHQTFTNYISTPKGQVASKMPVRSGYIPHKGSMKKFVDTSKLTDRELEVARDSGILTGSTRVPEQIEKNRRKRDEFLSIRRKLNLD